MNFWSVTTRTAWNSTGCAWVTISHRDGSVKKAIIFGVHSPGAGFDDRVVKTEKAPDSTWSPCDGSSRCGHGNGNGRRWMGA